MQPTARVALLIDGDNISPTQAGTLTSLAALHGDLVFARAYVNGNVKNDGWVKTPGIDALVTGAGGNVSDFRLSFEAVEMETKGGYDVFVIASNDTDLLHIVRWLREKGRTVIVAGTDVMGKALRTSGAGVFIMPKVENGEAKPLPRMPIGVISLEEAKTLIRSMIEENGGSIPMTAFGTSINKFYGIKAKAVGQKTWSRFFEKEKAEFAVTGPDFALILSLRNPAPLLSEEIVHAEC